MAQRMRRQRRDARTHPERRLPSRRPCSLLVLLSLTREPRSRILLAHSRVAHETHCLEERRQRSEARDPNERDPETDDRTKKGTTDGAGATHGGERGLRRGAVEETSEGKEPKRSREACTASVGRRVRQRRSDGERARERGKPPHHFSEWHQSRFASATIGLLALVLLQERVRAGK